MNYKHILRWVPKVLFIKIIITSLVNGIYAIVSAEIIRYITSFDQANQLLDIWLFLITTISILSLLYFVSLLNMKYIFDAILIVNQTIKEKYILYHLSKSYDIKQANSQNLSSVVNDFKYIEQNYTTLFFQIFFNIPIIVFAGLYLIYHHFLLGSLYILLSTLTFIPSYLLRNKLNKNVEVWSAKSSLFLRSVKESFRGKFLSKTYFSQKESIQNVKRYLNELETSLEKMNFFGDFSITLSAYLSTLGQFLPIIFSLILVINGEFEVSLVLAMVSASDRLSGPLEQSLELKTKMESTKNMRAKMVSFLEHQRMVKDENVLPQVYRPLLDIKDVSFKYRETFILKGMDIKIPYGEKVLITGPSGSGKTTIFNLLQGLIKPAEGKIRIVDNNAIHYPDGLGIYARINQEPILFSETLKFNLTLGKEFPRTEILSALDRVMLLHELGEDYLDRELEENGSKLSGGQKQRIEIARALLHDKKVILMDEGTANLDKETAQSIRSILYKLDKTIIEIAHHYNHEEIDRYGLKHYELKEGFLKEKKGNCYDYN